MAHESPFVGNDLQCFRALIQEFVGIIYHLGNGNVLKLPAYLRALELLQ